MTSLLPPHVKSIDDFKLGKSLGKGAFGEVFEATLHGGTQTFAIKRLRDAPADEDITQTVLQREAKNALTVEDFYRNELNLRAKKNELAETPHLVRCFGAIEDNNGPVGIKQALVFERCDGNLRQLIEETKATRKFMNVSNVLH